jgi:hypothetical protein
MFETKAREWLGDASPFSAHDPRAFTLMTSPSFNNHALSHQQFHAIFSIT